MLRVQDALKQLERFSQHIRCTIQSHMKLLHSFRPATFRLQGLKLPVLFVENGLFGIEHQAIGRIHDGTSMQDSRDSSERYQTVSKGVRPAQAHHSGLPRYF